MARTESAMIPLGTAAPAFDLADVISGEHRTLEQLRGEHGLLVMFICKHCPFVMHVEKELAAIGKDFAGKGIGIVAISSNDAEAHPEDAPESLKRQAEKLGFDFRYLYDETQEVARAYSATCTPDFFLFDKGLKLVYRGQLDDSRPSNLVPVTGRDLRSAMNLLLENKPVPEQQKPSIGCNIKWKNS
ncbi:PPO candidate 1 [Acidisarcina polymorpha]|uniref:PPO candidate 1 n=1 Tax=Acidisarcina polymorpha TaxID=2211140 RepID=A0A2Z5FVM8_9BACT|nr:thioredoxin family protein [Acidisarcina polymorpha]AXC10800.1 PPO candidate 1 [Acidisarcina polymorpha]